MSNSLQVVRELCGSCRTSPTSKEICGTPFEARHLNKTQSVAARYGVLESSQLISEGLAVIFPGALDGAEWNWEEIIPAMVQSRATGGLSKFECGFDPQSFKRKHHKKTQRTERLYIHHKECMLNYIASTLQENDRSTAPVYIRNTDSIIEVSQNQAFVVELMMTDMRSMARAIDGNSVLGNWAGNNGGEGAVTPQTGSGIQAFPHFDGAIKQSLLQGDNTYYPSVDVALPAIAGSAAYFVKSGPSWKGAYTDVATLVTGLNELALDITGKQPYSAVDLGSNNIRVTGSDPEANVYSLDALQIFYAEDGTVTTCSQSLEATVVQNAMPYSEEPILFQYTDINSLNFYDYFKDVIRTIRRKVVSLYDSGMAPESVLRRQYIAIDPLIYAEKDFAALQELCGCENAGEKLSILDRMFPRFVPYKALEGTGLWYWTTQDNFIVLTNAESDKLHNTEIWYDQNCGDVKSRNEMLLNAIIADFSLFATNALGSPFHDNLTDPYQPENLPHLAPDCQRNTVCGASSSNKAIANVCYEYDETEDEYTLTMEDNSSVSQGLTITAYEWTVYLGAATAQPAVQASDVEVVLTPAQYEALTLVTMKITLSDTSELFANVPGSQIEICC